MLADCVLAEHRQRNRPTSRWKKRRGAGRGRVSWSS